MKTQKQKALPSNSDNIESLQQEPAIKAEGIRVLQKQGIPVLKKHLTMTVQEMIELQRTKSMRDAQKEWEAKQQQKGRNALKKTLDKIQVPPENPLPEEPPPA